MSLIVPGVLNGSKGALLYQQEHIAEHPQKWNLVPLTVRHPFDPLTNTPLSAKDRGVWKRQGIGFVDQASFNGKLQSYGYFDVERTKKRDPRIYNALVSGQKIELSTGLFTDNIPKQGTYNGRPYEYVAVNYRPDHVAILPDETGACSVRDGCGVNNKFTQPRADQGRFGEYGDVHKAADVGSIHLSDDDHTLGADASRQLATRGDNPASWVKDEDKWEKAKTAASKTYDRSDPSYWAVVTHIYKNMGGAVANQAIDLLTENDGWVTLEGGQHVYAGKGGLSFTGPKAGKSVGEHLKGALKKGSELAASLATKAGEALKRAAGYSKIEGGSTEKAVLASSDARNASFEAHKPGGSSAEAHRTAKLEHARAKSAHFQAAQDAKKRGDTELHAAHMKAAKAHEAASAQHGSRQRRFGTHNVEADGDFDLVDFLIMNAGYQGRDQSGQFTGGEEKEDPQLEEQAAKEGMSVEELKDKMGIPQKGKGKPTKNSNPEGINQYSHGAHAATRKALDIGGVTKSTTESIYGASSQAVKAAAGGRSQRAADAHDKAAKMHEKIAEMADKRSDHRVASAHRAAAEAHRDAAAAHEEHGYGTNAAPKGDDYDTDPHAPASLVEPHGSKAADDGRQLADLENEGDPKLGGEPDDHQNPHPKVVPVTGNKDFTSDEERKAAFAHMESQEGPSKDAAAASGHAERTKSAGAHRAAAAAHREAAAHHKENDNDKGHAEHTAAARYHDSKARSSTRNCDSGSMGPATNDAHGLTKQAAAASLASEHEKAFGHAQSAMQSSKSGDSSGAADFHQKAAGAHEKQATVARKGGDEMQADEHDRAAALHRKAASVHAATLNQEVSNMTRSQKLAVLTANCSCDKDRAALNSLSDEALTRLVRTSGVRNAQGGDMDDDDDEDDDEDMETYAGKKKAEGSNADVTPGGGKFDQAGGEGVKKEYELSGNARQWLSDAPKEIQSLVGNALATQKAQKVAIVRALIANVADDGHKRQLINIYRKMEIPQLRAILAAQPTVNAAPIAADPLAIYLGAEPGNVPVANFGGIGDGELPEADTLAIPTINYQDMSPLRPKERIANAAS